MPQRAVRGPVGLAASFPAMLYAAIGSTGYKLLLIVHLLAVVTAFGPLFAFTSLRKAGPEVALRLYLRVVLPALVVVWVAGMGLVGMSDKVWQMKQGWISASLAVWLILLGLGIFVMRPALKAGEAGSARVGMATGISHLLVVVAIYLMVFKPGL